MKTTTISIKDLLKDNQRLCLSAKRSLNKCYECIYYEKCESKIINEEYEKKIKRVEQLKNQIGKLQEEIKGL